MANSELRADSHSIEPIPDADRDSTGLQQMWIWAGANIAPVNWALGALGIILKLGLWETIAVIVIGNIFGCAIFAAFTVMGHKTGVSQMVLSRSAFGRRGAYLPSVLMFLMTLCWIGVNTYFPVKIGMAILGQFGIPDNYLVTFIVITVVMVLQVGIGIYGFYAIRTFEKYTVPPTVAIMVLMSVLAWSRPGVVNWSLTSPLPPGAHLAMLSSADDRDRCRLGNFLGDLGLGLFALRAAQRPFEAGLLVQLYRHVRAVGLACDPRRDHRQRYAGHRSGEDGQRGVRRCRQPAGAADGAARSDRNQHPQRLFGGAGGPERRASSCREQRWR